MRPINRFSLKLKMFFSLWGSLLVFRCYQIVALKDVVHRGVMETITLGFMPPLCSSRCSSMTFRREMIAKDLDAGLGNVHVFSTQYCFGPSCAVRQVSGFDSKEHLNFPNYVDHGVWNLLCKHWPFYKSTDSIPFTISLAFSNNHTDLECE
jgi:hypothetical protein